jgi:hypothetical protein
LSGEGIFTSGFAATALDDFSVFLAPAFDGTDAEAAFLPEAFFFAAPDFFGVVFFCAADLSGDVCFFTGAFFAGAFFAGAFFAGDFFAGAFFAGVFFAGAFWAAVFFGADFLAPAVFLAAVFLDGALFDITFFADVFFAVVFFELTVFLAVPFFFGGDFGLAVEAAELRLEVFLAEDEDFFLAGIQKEPWRKRWKTFEINQVK